MQSLLWFLLIILYFPLIFVAPLFLQFAISKLLVFLLIIWQLSQLSSQFPIMIWNDIFADLHVSMCPGYLSFLFDSDVWFLGALDTRFTLKVLLDEALPSVVGPFGLYLHVSYIVMLCYFIYLHQLPNPRFSLFLWILFISIASFI